MQALLAPAIAGLGSVAANALSKRQRKRLRAASKTATKPRKKARKAAKLQGAAAANLSVAPVALQAPMPTSQYKLYDVGGGVSGLRAVQWLCDVQASGTGNPAYTSIPWNSNIFGTGVGYNVCPIDPSFWNNPTGSITQVFRLFRIKSLKVHYYPSAPTSTSGQIIMAIQPDVGGPSVPSGSNLKNTQGSRSFPPWAPATVTGEFSTDWHYITDTNSGAADDNRLGMAGSIGIAGFGLPASAFCGSIYVEFDCELKGLYPTPSLSAAEHPVLVNTDSTTVCQPTPARAFTFCR